MLMNITIYNISDDIYNRTKRDKQNVLHFIVAYLESNL